LHGDIIICCGINLINLDHWEFRNQVNLIDCSFSCHGDFVAVQKGDRIAQLILERIYLPQLLELEVSWMRCLVKFLFCISSQS